MEKLTGENIRFIDRYLKNSGVEFLDIRIEMTDHVACEIESRIDEGDERDFYIIFKEFMVLHKASLLADLKKFRKEADKKIYKKIFSNLYHPKTLLVTGGLSMVFHFLLSSQDVDPGTLRLFFYLPLFAIGFLSFSVFGRKKYLYLDQLMARAGALYLVLLNFPGESVFHSFWYFVFLILISVSISMTAFELFSFYKKHYKLS